MVPTIASISNACARMTWSLVASGPVNAMTMSFFRSTPIWADHCGLKHPLTPKATAKCTVKAVGKHPMKEGEWRWNDLLEAEVVAGVHHG